MPRCQLLIRRRFHVHLAALAARVPFLLPWTLCALLFSLVSAPALAHSPHDVIDLVEVTLDGNGKQVIFGSMQLTGRRMFGRSFDNGNSWTLTALPFDEREISRICFSPNFARDNTVFVSTTNLGILKSTDRGNRWLLLDSGGLDVRVLDMAVSPDFARDQTLWATTGSGIFMSSDGGENWTLSSNGLREKTQTVLKSAPDEPGVLFSADFTVHRSDDGGDSWLPQQVFSSPVLTLSVSPHFSLDQTAALVLKDGNGVFTTVNGGLSWEPMVLGLPAEIAGDVSVGPGGVVYVVTETSGLFRGRVGGTFENVGKGFEKLSDLTTNHFRTVDVSPDFASDGVVWVGGFEGLFRSGDEGDVFRQMDIYHQKYVRTVSFAPDYADTRRVYLQTYGGGLLRSPPQVPGGSGLPGGSQASGGSPPPGSGVAVPGTSPHSGAGRTLEGAALADPDQTSGPFWESISGAITALFGQRFVISDDFVEDRTMFYAQAGLWRSENAGQEWASVSLPASVPVVRALSLSPEFLNDKTVFMGAGLGGGAFRSHDSGDTWVPMTEGLPSNPSPGEFLFSPDYGSDSTVFLADRANGFFISSDGGRSWGESNTGLLQTILQAAAISPDFQVDQQILVGSSKAGVFVSNDGGNSWESSNLGLPPDSPLSIESIAYSPAYAVDRTIFIAVLAAGVYRSTDGGVHWAPVGPGLPADAPRVVAVSPDFAQDGTLIVSTYAWVYRSLDRGESFTRLPGFARVDDSNNILFHHTVASEAVVAPPRDVEPRPEIDPQLKAWLLEGACPGVGLFASTSADSGDLWPSEIWEAGALALSVRVSQDMGDYVALDFLGDSIQWHAPRGPDMGRAHVVVDGSVVETLDLYAPTELPSSPVFDLKFIQVRSHRIRVVNAGKSHPASAGVLRSDGFSYTY
ncbi:MAG: hypothetical protein P8N09_00700 [Planctomycetota bacterium]|nr:hypothetical protein [Planctomycetota bacterium]